MLYPNRLIRAVGLAALLICLLPLSALAKLEVASVFGDHMVLQRNQPIPVWGIADPGVTVSVSLDGKKTSAQADADGKWQVKLPASPAKNQPLTLTVSADNENVTISDVLVGEVWLCSGQSNMEWQVRNSNAATDEIAAANFPQIRFLTVPRRISGLPQSAIEAAWTVCSPETVGTFSAVGYFFGRNIHQQLGVPVGLINSSWGGTPAETWMRQDTLRDNPLYAQLITARDQRIFVNPDDERKFQEKIKVQAAEWEAKIGQLLASPGKPSESWFSTANDGAGQDWQECAIPGSIERALKLKCDGSFWLRTVFDVSPAAANGEATLKLGPIDDFDFTWINGKLVGKTGAENTQAWNTPRVYQLPAGTLRPGKNVLVIRVIDRQNDSVIRGMEEEQRIETANGERIILGGKWQARLETNLGFCPNPTGGLQNLAGTLYDGMIAPLIPYGIRGAIWYQGESNAGRAEQYRSLFPHLITNWRQDWQQGDFPFYFVQLANYMARKDQPEDSNWAMLREAQLMTLSLPNTGMATIIDIGEAKDIHPRNKQDVGHRLALIALSRDYGVKDKENKFLWFKQPLEFSGPIYKSMKVSGDKIVLSFDHVGKGLADQNKDGGLHGFAISGDGKKFVWADAIISGDKVIVSSPKVPNPVAVRYAWADNPAASLYNLNGLPASPFRTDK